MQRLLFTLLLAAPLLSLQDPEKPAQARPPLRLVDEPFRTPVERRDLLQDFSQPSPLEGIYALREIARDGFTMRGARGFLHVGRPIIMTLETSLLGKRSHDPFLQSSVRNYRLDGDRIVTTTLIGHEYDGKLAIEATGRTEVRRFVRTGTVLRIFKDPRSYMEFVRIE